MTVDNVPVPTSAPTTTLALDERRVKALEDQARALEKSATATDRYATAVAGITDIGGPKSERFERILRACLIGKVATNVEGFLTFARELCDGIEREFPPPEAT